MTSLHKNDEVEVGHISFSSRSLLVTTINYTLLYEKARDATREAEVAKPSDAEL